jgi:hypothetical protein
MLDIIFICMLNQNKKEIKIDKPEKGCVVFVDTKEVGNAKNDISFCDKLAVKVKSDLEKKGYKCEVSVKK